PMWPIAASTARFSRSTPIRQTTARSSRNCHQPAEQRVAQRRRAPWTANNKVAADWFHPVVDIVPLQGRAVSPVLCAPFISRGGLKKKNYQLVRFAVDRRFCERILTTWPDQSDWIDRAVFVD